MNDIYCYYRDAAENLRKEGGSSGPRSMLLISTFKILDLDAWTHIFIGY